jgi:hypothetical protein
MTQCFSENLGTFDQGNVLKKDIEVANVFQLLEVGSDDSNPIFAPDVYHAVNEKTLLAGFPIRSSRI